MSFDSRGQVDQFAQYNGFKSQVYLLKSGVPQGSKLGPLLFTVFTKDLLDMITLYRQTFEVDLELYQSTKYLRECSVLQEHFSVVIQKWCVEN